MKDKIIQVKNKLSGEIKMGDTKELKKIKKIYQVVFKEKNIMIIMEYQMHYVEEQNIKIKMANGKENILHPFE